MRDYVLTVFLFSLLPVCFYRPWLGIIVWYWFGLMNPHRLTWGFAYDTRFALYVGGVTLVGAFLARDRKPIPWSPNLVIVIILFVYFAFTTLFAWAPEEAWDALEKLGKVILMTLVACMFIYGKDRIRILLLTIALSVGFYGVKGALYAIAGGGGRVVGPPQSFMDGNTFIGLAFNMVLPLLIYLSREETVPWLKRVLQATAGLTVIATIFTLSRGAYLGLAVIIPLIYLRAQRKFIAACILIPAVLIAPNVLPDRVFNRVDELENYQTEGSANQRLQSWTVAFNLAKDHPFTGGGFSFESSGDEDRWMSYTSEKYAWALQHSSAAHSIYFQVLGQHGFVAFALFLALLFGTLLSLQRTKALGSSAQEGRWIASYASGIQLGTIGYMISGAFLSSAYFDLIYIYVAVSAILAGEVRSVLAQTRGLANRNPTARQRPVDVANS